MKFLKYSGLLLLVAVFFILSPSTKADFMSEEQQSIQTAKKITESTVKVLTSSNYGTGFYISPTLILTNWHVVKEKNSVIIINANKDSCYADVVRKEEYVDLALLKTNCSSPHLTLQDTSYIGQTVIVVGHPSSYNFTVSKGVVSAQRERYIQFDANVNFGSSGGAVANLNGEILGVVTKKIEDDGIGLAVPANRINQFLERAKE